MATSRDIIISGEKLDSLVPEYIKYKAKAAKAQARIDRLIKSGQPIGDGVMVMGTGETVQDFYTVGFFDSLEQIVENFLGVRLGELEDDGNITFID